jgi:hypothetical protein
MPRQDHPGSSQRPSRRTVLRGAAGAGAAGVAATAMSGLGSAAYAADTRTGTQRHAADELAADNSEQFVVHVRDARTGQIDVFRGDRQTRLYDRDLAKLLDRRSRR